MVLRSLLLVLGRDGVVRRAKLLMLPVEGPNFHCHEKRNCLNIEIVLSSYITQ